MDAATNPSRRCVGVPSKLLRPAAAKGEPCLTRGGYDNRFKVGDEVFGSTAPRNGCSAELVAVYERETQPKPAHLSWNEAAAPHLPTKASTPSSEPRAGGRLRAFLVLAAPAPAAKSHTRTE